VRGEVFVVFILIAAAVAFVVAIAFDASDCSDHGGVMVRTMLGGVECMPRSP
jgi:hypothetical protein